MLPRNMFLLLLCNGSFQKFGEASLTAEMGSSDADLRSSPCPNPCAIGISRWCGCHNRFFRGRFGWWRNV